MIQKSIDLIDDRQETKLDTDVESSQSLHANLQLSIMRPTFYNPPKTTQLGHPHSPFVRVLQHTPTVTLAILLSPLRPSGPDEYDWAILVDGTFLSYSDWYHG
ncbi:hypothetical protein RMATCC62417_15609 [Rhizopus microsporus]|nr:hypothetical protein RMATCC62417_15609 [Rhizopus microsporus]